MSIHFCTYEWHYNFVRGSGTVVEILLRFVAKRFITH